MFKFRVKSSGFRILGSGSRFFSNKCGPFWGDIGSYQVLGSRCYRVMQRQMRLCSDIPGYTGAYSGLYAYTEMCVCVCIQSRDRQGYAVISGVQGFHKFRAPSKKANSDQSKEHSIL